MASWSGMRHKLETEYLADALRGRVQYMATTYRKSHDSEGRAAIRIDGQEVLRGNYFNQFYKRDLFPQDEKTARRRQEGFPFLDDTALDLGLFDQSCFYRAFAIFDNESIAQSLQSENLLVRIFAVLDKRVGKRRLRALYEAMDTQPMAVQPFLQLRCEAEGIVPPREV